MLFTIIYLILVLFLFCLLLFFVASIFATKATNPFLMDSSTALTFNLPSTYLTW